ncbi:MAG: hypothetical protein H7Y39_18120, partial [Nitrospiraceae bacterium]|nr:hypothetical protein [Nitrospiraceae bacterium]
MTKSLANRISWLVEEWLQQRQSHLSNEIKNLAQETVNGLLAPSPTLVQRYKGSALRLHFHVKVRSLLDGQWKFGYLCFVTQYAGMKEPGQDIDRSYYHGSINSHTNSNNIHLPSGQMYVPMLIYVGERIENPQGVAIGNIPSMVWLHSLNEC